MEVEEEHESEDDESEEADDTEEQPTQGLKVLSLLSMVGLMLKYRSFNQHYYFRLSIYLNISTKLLYPHRYAYGSCRRFVHGLT